MTPRRTLVKERRVGAVKLPHIKGEVCWGVGVSFTSFLCDREKENMAGKTCNDKS